MSTPEQMIIQHTKDISALQESARSAHKRIDENDRITTGIHKLAANMENLTTQVKNLADRLEEGLREQGKRIGDVEKVVIKMSNIEEDLKTALIRIERIEREPADRWKSLTAQIFSLIVAAIIGAVVTLIKR